MDIVSEFEDVLGISRIDEPAKLEEARTKLDAGLGAELFTKYKAKEQKLDEGFSFFDPRYTTLMLGAFMMQLGANIAPEDRQHLMVIFPNMPSRNGFVFAMSDDGFRDPGQVQYKVALENYVDGNPRSF